MNYRRVSVSLGAILFLSILIIVGLTWVNYRYTAQNQAMNNFFPRWAGTRLLMMKGWSPYSQQTTDEIQQMAYGRLAQSGEDRGYFVYPLYSSLIYAPFSLTDDFALANALWMTILELSIIAIFVISVSLSQWRPSPVLLIFLFIFTALWYHTLRPILSSNASILSVLFIVLALLAIRSNVDALAGISLALASIKPQMVLILYVFILIWAVSTHRWTLIWSLLGFLVFFIAAGSLLVPNWIVDNIRQVILFSESKFISTPGAIISYWLPGIGRQVGWALTGIMVGVLLIEWRHSLGKEFRWFYWTVLLTLVINNLIGIYTTLENYIILYPAIILISALLDKRWGGFGRGLIVLLILIMTVGLWGILVYTANKGSQPDLDPIIFFFMPLLTLFGLYWVRWWALRPMRLPLEEFAERFG